MTEKDLLKRSESKNDQMKAKNEVKFGNKVYNQNSFFGKSHNKRNESLKKSHSSNHFEHLYKD